MSLKKLAWFRYRRFGFGVSPRWPAGWIFTAAFIALLQMVRSFAHPSHGALPLWFHITCGALLACYIAVAFLTATKDA